MGINIEKQELKRDKKDIRKARIMYAISQYMGDKKDMMLEPWDATTTIYGALAVFFWIDNILYITVFGTIAYYTIAKNWIGWVISLLIMYIVPLIVRSVIEDVLFNKSNKIFKEKEEKYLHIRNKYISETLIEKGYSRTGAELADCAGEEWANDNGTIKKLLQGDFISCTLKEYMNFGYVVVGHLSEYDIKDKNTAREKKQSNISMLERYNGKKVERISLGVRQFDLIYDVYTIDEVKARTYLSSVIVERLLKNDKMVLEMFEQGYEVRGSDVNFKMQLKCILEPGAGFREKNIDNFIKNAQEYVAGVCELDTKIDKCNFIAKGEY